MNGKNEMVTVPSILNAMNTEGRQKESDRYKEQIHSYIKAHKLEMTETLKALIKIPSVRTSAEENAPFGSSIATICPLHRLRRHLSQRERLFVNTIITQISAEKASSLPKFVCRDDYWSPVFVLRLFASDHWSPLW